MDPWLARARHERLAVLVDLDERTLLRNNRVLERGAVHALDALLQCGVQVIVVSDRQRADVEPLVQALWRAWWIAEQGAWGYREGWQRIDGLGWVREQLAGAHVIALGGEATFRALGGEDIAIGVGRRHALAHAHLSGPTALRDFLWWIVEARTRDPQRMVPLEALPSASVAPSRTRLLVLSNRTPPATTGRDRPVGGLVSALEPALRTCDGIWLGWSGRDADGPPVLAIDPASRPVRASFDAPPGWRDRFYGGFCNRALWPLFHAFPSRVRYVDEDWRAYVAANETYARFASELIVPDGTIWIHDYHLLLAGRALRRLGHKGPIGLFLHVPFPPCDVLDTLPWLDELIDAMCELDLVGFHTEQWAANFRACVARRGGRQPEVSVLPVGVDPASFALDTELDDEVARLRAVLGPRRLILGVDRLDYSKGIPERLIAFDHLLERWPEWRGKVTLVQISVPSRGELPEYAELRERVEHLVGNINGRYGEADWVPVRYLHRSYDHRVLAQLYRLAEVALVTPLRDGLNLVAKEFVCAQDPEQPGVLVLSRFAGAAAELTEAVLTNPYHPDGLAADLDRALRMPLDERRRRHALLSAIVAGSTPHTWAATFLDRLAGSHGQAA